MQTRRFRKRGGACPDGQDCPPTMMESATGVLQGPLDFLGQAVTKTKDVAQGAVGQTTGMLGNIGNMLNGNKTGGKRKTKRRRAKKRTRR